jgi:hypothetical protein
MSISLMRFARAELTTAFIISPTLQSLVDPSAFDAVA